MLRNVQLCCHLYFLASQTIWTTELLLQKKSYGTRAVLKKINKNILIYNYVKHLFVCIINLDLIHIYNCFSCKIYHKQPVLALQLTQFILVALNFTWKRQAMVIKENVLVIYFQRNINHFCKK